METEIDRLLSLALAWEQKAMQSISEKQYELCTFHAEYFLSKAIANE